jgi:sulfate adenylyltransferase subunit 1
VNTLEKVAADKLAMNDIAEVTFKLAQPLFVDPYLENRAPGPSSSSMKATTTPSVPG